MSPKVFHTSAALPDRAKLQVLEDFRLWHTKLDLNALGSFHLSLNPGGVFSDISIHTFAVIHNGI